MKSKPLVSIIIPCYNAERWVAAAIESALGQTYDHTEVVIIDDGSTDGSAEVVKQFGERVRFVSTQNRGPSAARNTGMKIARGDWIQFLDADDLLHSGKLQISLNVCEEHPDIQFVWAANTPVREEFGLTPSGMTDLSNLQVKISKDAFLAHQAPSAAMFRRALLDRVGAWDESLRAWEDFEYHARIAAELPLYASLNKSLYFYRQHGGIRAGHSDRNLPNIRRELEGMRATRVILEASRISPRLWKSRVWGSYLHLAQSFASVGDREMFVTLLREAADLRGSLKFRLKSQMAVFSSYLLGINPTMRMMDLAVRSPKSGSVKPA